MSISKRIVAIFLTLVMISGIATVNVLAVTSGGKRSSTVYLDTKANYFYPGSSSVTLKQSKQTLTYSNGKKTKEKKGYYGCYDITVYNVTKEKVKSVSWLGGKTKKIDKLDPNCRYSITVRYNAVATGMFTSAPIGYSLKYTSNPSWSVSSTWKVSSYW